MERKPMNMKTKFQLAIMVTVLASCTQVEDSDQHSSSKMKSAKTHAKGDGPFGLKLSGKVSDLNADESTSEPTNGFYILNSVPSPSPDFQTYAVVAFDGVGICQIRAISETIDSDSLGSAAMATTDRLAESLKSKYGEPKKTDICAGSDISCGYWAMSMMNGERAYSYAWTKPTDNLRSIDLFVTSDDLARLSTRLDYATGDKDACEKAENAARASNL